MKRDNFKITMTHGAVIFETVKHKWNSAMREVEKLVKEVAVLDKSDYRLTDSQSVKQDFNYIVGSRTWTGDNGNIIVFNIVKE